MAAIASANVLIPTAGRGIRLADVKVPTKVPEVAFGTFDNGRMTGPAMPGSPKWMWPAVAGANRPVKVTS